ncbi:cytochrome c3 family protein [Shewanella sp. 10N.286.51.B8]|uniref:cytochrome c3 family protein n=1 Tax=Shewanella sp. 10N.286.51.B8 TaxID=3229708 RepID=UPI00355091CF
MMNKNLKYGNLKKTTFAMMLLPLMTACGGSDSNDAPPPVSEIPEVELPDEIRNHFDLIVDTETAVDGTIEVYLGRWFPCMKGHEDMCSSDMPEDFEVPDAGFKNGEAFATASKYNMRTRDDSKYYMEVQLSDLRAWQEQAVRDDIFMPGNYSALDLMMYISSIRDDFEVKLGGFNEARQSYDFTVSFDADGDGTFDNAPATHYSHWGDYQDSDSWGVTLSHGGGDMLNDFNGYLETVYDRLDETLVRDGSQIRIQPVSEAYRDRVWQTHIDEVNFKASNGGKVILKEITLDMEDTDGYGDEFIKTIAQDVEVKAYNLRPDIYRPGVITSLDMVISANETAKEAGSAEFGFTFWPTLSTGSKLGSYVMNQISHPEVGPSNKLRAEGLDGWNYAAGMNEYTLDIIVTQGSWPSAQDFLDPEIAAEFELDRECSWLRESDGSITEIKAKECIDHWYGTFGGNKLHVAMDNMVRNHGMEYIYFSWVKKMFLVYNVSEVNSVNEARLMGDTYRFPAQVEKAEKIADISKAIAPLTEEHFGWNIADCQLCHSKDDIHKSKAVDTLERDEPYFCASCHGGNGAPEAHGETARCFWCHSEDKAMQNHGEASQWMAFSDVECSGFPQHMGPNAPSELFGPGSCADQVDKPNVVKQNWDGSKYNDLPAGRQQSFGNSDWYNTESFPDPYSCVTCHVTPKK